MIARQRREPSNNYDKPVLLLNTLLNLNSTQTTQVTMTLH